MTRHPLDSLLAPSSIAVIGASDRAGSVGQVVLRNLRAGGFAGELHPINDKHAEVQGMPSHAHVGDIGHAVELALVAIPAQGVPGVLRECGEAGAKNAVVLSAGFAERGAEGARLQAEALAIARDHHMRLLGPNCLGVVRPSAHLHAIFGGTLARPGKLALVSQSGAVCTAIMDWAEAREVGFSTVVSIGAAADVGVGDVLDYLALDAQTDAIVLYLEGVDHARRFMSGLRVAARMKPVIALKAGRQPAGRRAAVSHTGALVGNDAVFDSALRRAGAVRVSDLEQLFSTAELLARGRPARGDAIAIITNAGGLGVMAADRAADLELRVAELSAATMKALDAALPEYWSHANPVDLIGDASPERYARALEIVLADSEIAGTVVLLSPQAMTQPTEVAAAVVAASEHTDKLVLACFMGGAQVRDAHAFFAKHGVPHAPSPEAAVEAFAQLARFERNQRLLLEVPGPLCDPTPPDLDRARAIVAQALAEGRTQLSLLESKALLAAFKIPVTPSVLVHSSDEAAAVAARMGSSVVMKIDSPDISHKSDVGGVRLDVRTPEAARTAYDELLRAAALHKPDARIAGVSLEPMHGKRFARELMLGIARDEALGPALGFGAGGTLVELLQDSAVALPPLNRLLAREMIERTRVRRMLGPFRGMPAVNLDALEAALLRVSELACELPEILELDVNPLIADERGVLAVDARVVLERRAPGMAPYSHVAIQPFPSRLVRTIELDDGSRLTLRPIRPEDAQMEQRFMRQLSLESRYFRFHQGLVELTPRMLVRFTQLDYDRELAFVALRADQGRAGEEEELGVARYIQNPDAESCEFALVVADAWHGRHVGSHLMRALIAAARDKGLLRMQGEVLTENHKMLDLVRHLGFTVRPHLEDATLRKVELDLKAAAPAS